MNTREERDVDIEEGNMKIIKTVKDNKTTTEVKFSASDYTLIFGILGSIKFIVKAICNKRRDK